MCEAKFTWLPKFTNTLLSVPEEHQAALFRALAQYGNFGIEPDFDDWALKAVFESLREDIDNNKRFRSSGASGGRGRKKDDCEGVSDPETPLSDTENPPLGNSDGCETPLCDGGETQKGGSDFAPSIPYQSIPNHTKVCKRFRAPTPEEVEEYARGWCDQKGLVYDFNPQRFCDFYESKGWKVGRNPMKDWKAAVRTWLSDAKRKGVGKSEYSDL